MRCKKFEFGRLVCSAATVALIASAAQADHHMVAGTSGNMSGSMAMSSNMGGSTQPIQVTGTVVRYYVDRSGYITAMDLQTAEGVRMLRFAPGMAQRLYTTYPVGGQATLYVTPRPVLGMTRMDVISMGNTQPQGIFMPYTASDLDLLRTEPYVMAGAQPVTARGRFNRFITDPNGEVLGMVLTRANVEGMTQGGGMMMGSNEVLVRIPPQFRHAQKGITGNIDRAAPAFQNSAVEVVGMPEAPRYGSISRYADRIIASAIVINGRSVGALGFPRLSQDQLRSLINLNLFGSKTDEERTAAGMGYTTYDSNMMGMMGSGSMSGSGSMGAGTGTTSPQ